MAEVNPPFFMQTGAHPAAAFRRVLENVFRYSGIVSPGDLAVTPDGSNRAVSVAAGECIIVGTQSAGAQGAYACYNNGPKVLAIAAPDPSLARIDKIVAQVLDAEYSGASNLWQLAVVTGAAGGAIPATPANALELARLAVNPGDTSFTSGDISRPPPLVRSGSLLASHRITADGTAGTGTHNSGLTITFTMPALAPGQKVLVEASGYAIQSVSNIAAGTAIFALLQHVAMVAAIGTAFTIQPAALTAGPLPVVRALIDNADPGLSAGSVVTINHQISVNDGGASGNTQIDATANAPAFLTARIV